jgi:hypothetical protein
MKKRESTEVARVKAGLFQVPAIRAFWFPQAPLWFPQAPFWFPQVPSWFPQVLDRPQASGPRSAWARDPA